MLRVWPSCYTVLMHSHFTRLRLGGNRRAARDISSDCRGVGHISVFNQCCEVVAAAYATGGRASRGRSYPLLYRVEMETMQGNSMLLQGWEGPQGCDQKDTEANKQEWSIKLFVDAPPVRPPNERLE